MNEQEEESKQETRDQQQPYASRITYTDESHLTTGTVTDSQYMTATSTSVEESHHGTRRQDDQAFGGGTFN